MNIPFDKMHALGNDFVFIDQKHFSKNFLTSQLISSLSNRKYGIGCDLVSIYHVCDKNVYVSFWNQDGTQAELCCNATRCLGLLLKNQYHLDAFTVIACNHSYEVDASDRKNISILLNKPNFLTQFKIDHVAIASIFEYDTVICDVEVGNPHCVCFINTCDVLHIENYMENKKIDILKKESANANISFVKLIDSNSIEIKVFERGVGWTLACGSAAMATVALAHKNNILTSDVVKVRQLGGELIMQRHKDLRYTQVGSATYVFSGLINI